MQSDHYEIFLSIVEHGSLSKAASHLGLPKSTVSRKLQELEDELKVSLLHRTTRKISPTHEGQQLTQRIRPLLKELQDVKHEFANNLGPQTGLIRVTGPLEFNFNVVAKMLRQYQSEFPHVTMELNFTNRIVNLVEEKYDLAIRAGNLKDSQLIARKFGCNYFGLYISPQLLKTMKPPRDLNDMKDIPFILFQPADVPRQWKLVDRNGKAQKFDVKPRYTINNIGTIKEMVIAGVGYALLPDFQANKEVTSGQMVPVLPHLSTSLNDLFLVYPKRVHTPKYLESFINLALRELKLHFAP